MFSFRLFFRQFVAKPVKLTSPPTYEILNQFSHAKISPTLLVDAAYQTRNQEINLLRKYKRKIQMILRSDEMPDILGRIQIKNLISSEDGRTITVLWTISEDDSNLSVSISQQVDMLLSQSVARIRQKISRENAFKRVPSLTFIHDTNQAVDERPTNFRPETEIIKPNNVYGLPWKEYMQKVHTATSRTKENQYQIVNDEGENEKNSTAENPSETAKWARMWREQNSARMIARRERKRSHQLLGLHQLNKEMEEINRRNSHDDEDI